MNRMRIALALCALALLCGFGGYSARAEEAPATVEIYDRSGLEAMASAPDANYVLMADIDMKDAPWTPVELRGSFDGKGHTLYNLTVREPDTVPGVSIDGNRKKYDTYYAGFFSKLVNAEVRDLTLLGVDVNIDTSCNCFAAALAGYAENAKISGCRVEGRVYLRMTNRMCGVAGLVGFGYGTVSSCSADVTLVFVDGNTKDKCEQFLGGVLACGYCDIENCSVKLKGYASVHGYVHNGGLVGMHRIHTEDNKHNGYVRGCDVDAVIAFFEHNSDRRAYCKPYIGETLNKYVTESGNTTARFENNETKKYDQTLLPERCDDPEYAVTVTPPSCTEYGYTTHECVLCGNVYRDAYTYPAHTPGEFVTVAEASYEQAGRQERRCASCGLLMEEAELPKLAYVSSCALDRDALKLTRNAQARLKANVEPTDAANPKLAWSSSDESVVTVDQTGAVRARGSGDAVVRVVSEDGNASAECAVTVRYTWQQWLVEIFLFGWAWG